MWWMQFEELLSYDGTVREQTSGELAQLVGLSDVCHRITPTRTQTAVYRDEDMNTRY